MNLTKKYIDPQIGEVVFRKKAGVRRMSIRVSGSRGVSVTIPYLISFDEAFHFFMSKREWVLKTLKRQESIAPALELNATELPPPTRGAAASLPGRPAGFAWRYGFEYSTLRLKHNRTNWGSCSSKGNINLNISLMRVPPLLRDYVILHELCHLRHPDHGKGFHLLLEHFCTNLVLEASDSGDSLASSIALQAAASITSNDCLSDILGRNTNNVTRKSKSFPIEFALSTELRRYRP